MKAYLILTVTVFFFPLPSVALAVILTLRPFPAFFAFTTPFEDTVAYLVLELVHLRVLFAFLPVVLTVAFTFNVFPAFTVFFAFSVILLTASF